ncbi:MAG TPA: bifunctional 5,10-methylenetetrahydrofolate dehydrogenase/5,10-methenyltetrahydrofolate cyclohydrolase [Chloroflexota bacterium]|nr:bifunctional 5,10-methylenetetrahydrofolate dehydrogenase/5,10-methenyltetrahydrofolate cyclohydrolase [Chloroflexota bacterium]
MLTATSLDGRPVAALIWEDVASRAASFAASVGRPPRVALVAVDEDPEFGAYAGSIERSFGRYGLEVARKSLGGGATQGNLEQLLRELGVDSEVDGVLLQAPLPAPLDGALAIARSLPPEKDIEGIHPAHSGALAIGKSAVAPSTPAGGMEILKFYGIAPQGKRAVIIGRSAIVGRPLSWLLLAQDATVTVCHSRTIDLPLVTREADILAAAIGRPGFVSSEMVKPGAVVLDFGTTYVDGKLRGDVDADTVMEIAGALTPVPGGTGPVTTAVLGRCLIEAAERLKK